MAITFPPSPAVNDEFTSGDVTYIWTGVVWKSKNIAVATPTAHATSHENGGSDEITVTTAQITGLDTVLAGKADATLVDNDIALQIIGAY